MSLLAGFGGLRWVVWCYTCLDLCGFDLDVAFVVKFCLVWVGSLVAFVWCVIVWFVIVCRFMD